MYNCAPHVILIRPPARAAQLHRGALGAGQGGRTNHAAATQAPRCAPHSGRSRLRNCLRAPLPSLTCAVACNQGRRCRHRSAACCTRLPAGTMATGQGVVRFFDRLATAAQETEAAHPASG